MSAYLFVHFREKSTPDGEQVYFSISKDGRCWEPINKGTPVLWSYFGDQGVRDFTIVRAKEEKKFYIIATDLSLSYGLRGKYHNSWEEIRKNGSRYFSIWESEDLVNWTQQRLQSIEEGAFGCMWAPDVIYDSRRGEYLIHWSSNRKNVQNDHMAIYCSRTKDFYHFTKPEVLYRDEKCSVIDSAMYEENGKYYLFVKEDKDPIRIRLLESKQIDGGFILVEAFDECMDEYAGKNYEAPTAVKMDDGTWCLYLDYYGVPGEGQGYVPFLSKSLADGIFVKSDHEVSFPYGFKHGTILKITQEEYERIKGWDFSDKGWI